MIATLPAVLAGQAGILVAENIIETALIVLSSRFAMLGPSQ